MTTLDQIVRSVLNAEGGQGLHGYDRYLMMAYECLSDLQISLLSEVRTAVLTIDEEQQAVALPGDCIGLIKGSLWTGQPGDGSFRRLYEAQQSDIKITGRPTYQIEASTDGGYFEPFLNYLNPATGIWGAIYAQYGQGKESGTYYYDRSRQHVSLDTKFDNYPFFVCSYKSRGDKSSMLVPEDTFMTIRAWIQWQKIWDRRTVTVYEKNMKKSEYYNQRRLLRNRRYGLTVEDYNEARRLSYTAGVKLPESHAD